MIFNLRKTVTEFIIFIMTRVLLAALAFLPIAYANGLYVNYEYIPSHYLEQAIFDFSNAKRLEAGVGALSYDEQVALSARQHAHEMAKFDYVSHVSPIPQNSTLLQRAIQAGSPAQELGEKCS